ncbi:MAG: gliding motility-associated ABC transporter ATP-binding subunit GldA [Flavobacteriaceae bacterium]|nr:gliding motility-associated ABC transporter ATP-binding subunit GldA [Flavobacteriaceae bacterium]
MLLEVKNISKNYGNQEVLKDISFSLNTGEIVGLLGVNGVGKSTIMRIITGYIEATEGTVFVNEEKVSIFQNKTRRWIGYLPENNPLYTEMYVREYLSFHAEIHKVSKKNIEEVIHQVGLQSEQHKKIKELSKGYRQRVGLAGALLHQPKLLILDEPTTGLDPNQLVEIRSLIKSLAKDKAILLSTHIMQEVEAICNRVIVMHKGQIAMDRTLQSLQNKNEQIIEVTFDLLIEPQFLRKIPNISKIVNSYDATWELHFETEEDMRTHIFDFAQEQGLKIKEMQLKNKNLETLFKEITNKS